MRYEKNEYTNARIELDGNEYIECKFTSCTFVFRSRLGGEMKFEGNEMTGNTQIIFLDAALQTLGLMKAMFTWGKEGQDLIKGMFQTIAPGLKNLH
jgi:hypothetical protein